MVDTTLLQLIIRDLDPTSYPMQFWNESVGRVGGGGGEVGMVDIFKNGKKKKKRLNSTGVGFSPMSPLPCFPSMSSPPPSHALNSYSCNCKNHPGLCLSVSTATPESAFHVNLMPKICHLRLLKSMLKPGFHLSGKIPDNQGFRHFPTVPDFADL